MPEGDSIARLAARLRPALEGRTVVRFEAPRVPPPHPKAGATVLGVDSYGKYLMISFDDGFVLETHLRMTGRWDLYAPGERWRKPTYLARAVVAVDDAVAVCFAAPVVRLRRARVADLVDASADPDASGAADAAPPAGAPTVDLTGDEAVAGAVPSRRAPGRTGRARVRPPIDPRQVGSGQLGPDLCRPDADLDEAVRRMALLNPPDADIADVLLDQRVAAGVGNVFKSEVLWACELHPLTPLGAVDEPMRRRLVETAAAQLRANLGGGPRTTVPGPPGSVAVYGRGRRQCRRCGSVIQWRRTGRDKRTTYWCPTCQPEHDVPSSDR